MQMCRGIHNAHFFAYYNIILQKKQRKELHQCLDCGKRFSGKAHHSRHVRVVHERSFRIFCDICGKGMRDSFDLRRHMTTNHKIPADPMLKYYVEQEMF